MAACVQAGAAADPRHLSGLAHFCEHMCFLGSERYPGENDYKKYLAKHGGRSNASTSLHVTTYKFDVLADYAKQAVDIFSQFFVAPLFTPSGTSREVNAVDSENSKNLTNEDRRRWQILKELADPEHYFSKFTTGNAQTLPTTDETQVERVRDALLTFHRKHYRPDNLTVVIVGPQSLDTLQEWLIPRFGPMQSKLFPSQLNDMTEVEKAIEEAAKDAPNYSFAEEAAPYRPAFRQELEGGAWPVLLMVKPLRSMRKLTLLFPLPPVWKVPDQSPISVLSHLLGHEGPGSSFAVLQNQGWISSLSSGLRVSAPDGCLFQLSVGLTEDGESEWKQVVSVLLAHGRLIHETAMETQKLSDTTSSDLHRIWGEVAKLASIFFDQASPGNAYNFAPSLAQSIVTNGTASCISAGSMLSERAETFPLNQVVDFSSRLVASNCIIERCSQAAWDEMEKNEKSLEAGFGKKTEKWYGIDYYLTPIDQLTAQQWEAQDEPSPMAKLLHLPRPNRYIPRSLALVPDLPEEARNGPRIDKEIDPPNLLLTDEGSRRLWHRLDDRYALPKSSLTILLQNAAVEHILVDGKWEFDKRASVHSSLVASIFSEAMAQETYDADLAGLRWSLSLSTSGILLSFGGFSDRLPDLAIQILKDFLDPSFLKESYFCSGKDRMLRNLKSYFESRRADSYASYWRELLISSRGQGMDAAIAAAEATSLQSVLDHYKRLLSQPPAAVDCLFTGNVAEGTAREFFNEAMNMIDTTRSALVAANYPTDQESSWIPGPLERRLLSGEDVELHFSSKNLQEENGAVLITFQSQVPCFKGEGLSSDESLKSTAAIRLVCHMLREPLFDELRTKQQLGYIVNSYYDSGLNGRDHQLSATNGPLTTPVDLLVVTVLSRKMSPPDVAQRIDEFLQAFRDVLVKMPESELRDHANALSTKMLQPIQKLSTEASMHFAKIQRYSPEIFHQGQGPKQLPWTSVKTLAGTIRTLQRNELLQTWDQLVHHPNLRSRVVSCVYGTTHPLEASLKGGATGRRGVVVMDKPSEILNLRTKLAPFDGSILPSKHFLPPRFLTRWMNHPKAGTLGGAAVAILGAGVMGLVLTNRSKRAGK